jgi:hypothetical protein
MSVIVGLSGSMGSGKSTLAKQIAMHLSSRPHGLRCRMSSFGDALKKLVSVSYFIPYGFLYTEAGKNTVPDWAAKNPGDLVYSSQQRLQWDDVPQINYNTASLMLNIPLPFSPSSSSTTTTKKIPSLSYTTPIFVEFVNNILRANVIITRTCIQLCSSQQSDIMPLTCGRLLQIVGETFRNILGPDVWINALKPSVVVTDTDTDRGDDVAPKNIDVVIIDDVRYDNEATWIKDELGGVLIKVVGAPSTARSIAKRDPNHPSEQGLCRIGAMSFAYTADLRDRSDADFVREGPVCAKIVLSKLDQ